MIRHIDINVTQSKIVDSVEFFKKLPETDTTRETLFAKCIMREYVTWLFKEDDKTVGIVAFRQDHPMAFITALVLEGKTNKFYDLFYDKLREFRFTYLKAASNLDQGHFERFSGFKKLYSLYGKEL